jgi:hypothetical protein
MSEQLDRGFVNSVWIFDVADLHILVGGNGLFEAVIACTGINPRKVFNLSLTMFSDDQFKRHITRDILVCHDKVISYRFGKCLIENL